MKLIVGAMDDCRVAGEGTSHPGAADLREEDPPVLSRGGAELAVRGEVSHLRLAGRRLAGGERTGGVGGFDTEEGEEEEGAEPAHGCTLRWVGAIPHYARAGDVHASIKCSGRG
jgi:hypothetical protein